MAESDVKMADRTYSSLADCAGIIPSCFMLGEGILVCIGLFDASSVLGPLHMPPGIGNRKRLLTKQRSRPSHGVLVLVHSLLPFSGSRALDNGRQESEEAMDREDVEKEVVVVVAVVCINSAPLNRWYVISGVPVHPRFHSTKKDLVISPQSLHWKHSRGGRQVCRAFSCEQSDFREACFYDSFQLDHECLDSQSHHHVP